MTQLGWARVKMEPTDQTPVPNDIATFHFSEGAFKVRYPNGVQHTVHNGSHETFIALLRSHEFEVLCDGPGEGPPTCTSGGQLSRQAGNPGMPQRLLIPDDQTIVILDTNVARMLAYSPTPDWLACFQAMSKEGYSFSLADTTTAELILQVREGKITADEHRQMMGALETFLNPTYRALPSRIDLQVMIGNSTETPIQETSELSQLMWKQLSDPVTRLPVLGPTLEEIHKEERSDWPRWIKGVVRHAAKHNLDLTKLNPIDAAEHLASLTKAGLDSSSKVVPPTSVRKHLEILFRFRQCARSVQKKEPYDPMHPKKLNDGIDVDLFQYLILPAFILSDDSFFSSKLQDIKSFQKDWLYRPEKLAAEWKKGRRPRPEWPRAFGA